MMKLLSEQIVEKYFEAYEKHDIDAIKEIMHEEVTWYFMGKHPLAGEKHGIKEVVDFFDRMAEIMSKAEIRMEKLITVSNEKHFLECQRSTAIREDGNNLDHYTCVLWTVKEGKIIEGRHFFADPQAVDKYFTAVTAMPVI